MTVGFIGLGNMGFPVAERLVGAGHHVLAFDTRPEAVDALAGLGATRAASVAEVADRAQTVLASLPTPEVAVEVATELAGGTVAVMVSGPDEHVEAALPVLRRFGRPIRLGTRPGAAQTMKLTNNLLAAAALAVTSEAMVMGVKAGLDATAMIEVFNAGSGANTATRDKFPNAVLPRTFDYGFAAGLMAKDLRLCLAEAHELGLTLPVSEAVIQMWVDAVTQLGPEADFTAASLVQVSTEATVIQPVEQAAGVVVGHDHGAEAREQQP